MKTILLILGLWLSGCVMGVSSQGVDVAPDNLLWLVNSDCPLPASYVPNGMISYQNQRLHSEAAAAFTQLQTAMENDGVPPVSLHSSFRSYSRQKYLHARKVREYKKQGLPPAEATAQASRIVQPPGASEHQTGLALDVSSTGSLDEGFGETAPGIWLARNAHYYGFVIRYPATKTHTTGIVYEPWHLRYVGLPHAAIMHSRDLTLEEYGDYIAANSPYTFYCDVGEGYVLRYYTALPDVLPDGVISLSADRFGDDARYIAVSRKPSVMPLY
jgi:LAS superfamily LD-carboxypeptidase LdcB